MHYTVFSMKYTGIEEPHWYVPPEKMFFTSENSESVKENRKMVFHQKVFVLEFNPTMPFKEKQRWRKKVKEHGGTISYIVSRKVTFVVLFNEMLEKKTFKVKQARQYGIPVLRSEFIDDSLQKQQLMSVGVYYAGEAMDGKDFKKGKITALQKQRLTKRRRKQVVLNNLECWPVGDPDAPLCDDETSKLAKWALLKMKTDVQIIEVHTSIDSSKNKYRIYSQSGSLDTEQNLKAVEGAVVWFVDTSEEALSAYEQLYRRYTSSPYSMTQWTNPTFSSNNMGSTKFRLILGELCTLSTNLTPEVGGLVELLWTEATSEAAKQIDIDLRHIKQEKVEDAEAALLQLKEATQDLADDNKLGSLLEDFYSAMPHKAHHRKDRLSLREISAKLDLCQLVHDIIDVSEGTDWSESATTCAKFRALRCHVTYLDQSSEEYLSIKEKISSTSENIEIQNIFRVGRTIEDIDFRSDIGGVRLLMHSSATHNFLGILSRGLLLPKTAEGEHGISRTDQGFLGRGVYFSDSASKCAEYSWPSSEFGCRLLLLCDVALGNICDFTKKDTTLRVPPSGYDSVHGVKRSSSNLNSEFEDDEFVIYDPCQQRVRYVVEFHMAGDNITPLSSITQRLEDTNSEEEVLQKDIANIDISDIKDLPDPLQKISAGLISGAKKSVPLKSVHVRAKLLDMVAQVVVMQKYRNDNNDPIEAKYVFPLDDTAAVCGFEAFINGKHIIGKVKEKSTAHREYKEAISKGHGAYLMDEEEPDVFTVSVGNLPPQSDVLIKITYIAELQVEGESIAFRIPATVAPWVRDTALAQQTQSSLDTLKIQDGDRSSVSVQVAVEMPFDIRKVSSPTHQVKFKKTAAKAVVELPKNSHLDDGFILLVTLAEVHVPRMWVERHPDKDSQACMLAFYPEFEAVTDEEQEVIFLLDMSNSMKGQSARDAKKVMLLALEHLPDKSIFNIIIFGTSYLELFPAPQRKNKQNLEKALQFVQNTEPNLGGSNALSPAECLFLLSPPEGSRSIFVISDGYIPYSDLLLSSVQKSVVRNRVFTLGVGGNVNHHLMRTLASRGGGTYQYYNYKTRSSWQHRMKSQVDKACQPGISGVEVEWCQHSDYVPAPRQAPQNIPSIFNGSRLVVYGFADNCTQVKLKAVVDGMEISTMVTTTELNMTSGTILHQLTARAMIRDYEDGILSEDKIQQRILKMERKREIIDLSTEYSIVTPYTSFVAVEERDQEEEKVDGPSLEDLVSNETVDILPYLGWQNPDMFDDKDPVSIVEELLRKGAIAENFSQMEAQRCYVSILDYIPELKKPENSDLKEKVLDEVSRFFSQTDTEHNRTVLEKFTSSLPRDYDSYMRETERERLHRGDLLSNLDPNTAYYDPKTRSMRAGFVHNKYFPPDFDKTFTLCKKVKRKQDVTYAAGSHHGNSPMDLDTDEPLKSVIEEFGNSWENLFDEAAAELVMDHFDEEICDALSADLRSELISNEYMPHGLEPVAPTGEKRSTVFHAARNQIATKAARRSAPLADLRNDYTDEEESFEEDLAPTDGKTSAVFHTPIKQMAAKAARRLARRLSRGEDESDKEDSDPTGGKRSTVFHAPMKRIKTKAARISTPLHELTDDDSIENMNCEYALAKTLKKRSSAFHAPGKQLATKGARKSAPAAFSDTDFEEDDSDSNGEKESTVYHAPGKVLATKAARRSAPLPVVVVDDDSDTDDCILIEDRGDDTSKQVSSNTNRPILSPNREDSFSVPKSHYVPTSPAPVLTTSFVTSGPGYSSNDVSCYNYKPASSLQSLAAASSFAYTTPGILTQQQLSTQQQFLATRDFTFHSAADNKGGFGFGALPITTTDTMGGFGFGAPPITTAKDTMLRFGFGAPPITTTDTMSGFGFGAPPITTTDTMSGFGFGAPPITTTDTMLRFGFGAPPITTTDTMLRFGFGAPPITTTDTMLRFGFGAPPITITDTMSGFGFGAPTSNSVAMTRTSSEMTLEPRGGYSSFGRGRGRGMKGIRRGTLIPATEVTEMNKDVTGKRRSRNRDREHRTQRSRSRERSLGHHSRSCSRDLSPEKKSKIANVSPPRRYRRIRRLSRSRSPSHRGRQRPLSRSRTPSYRRLRPFSKSRSHSPRRRQSPFSRSRTPSYKRRWDSFSRSKTPSYRRQSPVSSSRTPIYRGRRGSFSRSKTPSPKRRKSPFSRSRTPGYRGRQRPFSSSKTPSPRRKRSFSSSRSPSPRRRNQFSRSKTPSPRRKKSSFSSSGRLSPRRSPRRRKSSVSSSRSPSPRRRRNPFSRRKTPSPRRKKSSFSRSRSPSPRRRRKPFSRSKSPSPRRKKSSFSRSRSPSPRRRRNPVSRSKSPSPRRKKSSFSRSRSPSPRRRRKPFSRSKSPSPRRKKSSFSRSRSPSPRRRRNQFSRSKTPSPRRRKSPFSSSRRLSPRRRKSSFSRSRSPSPRRRRNPVSRSKSPSPRRKKSPFSSSRRLSPRRSPRRRKSSFSRSRSPSPRRRKSPVSRSKTPSPGRRPESGITDKQFRKLVKKRAPVSARQTEFDLWREQVKEMKYGNGTRRKSGASKHDNTVRTRANQTQADEAKMYSDSDIEIRPECFKKKKKVAIIRDDTIDSLQVFDDRQEANDEEPGQDNTVRIQANQTQGDAANMDSESDVERHLKRSKKRKKLAIIRDDTIDSVQVFDDRQEAQDEEPGQAGIWTGIRLNKVHDIFEVVPANGRVPEYWELCPDLCESLGLSYEKITQILKLQGLYSLGADASKTAERFLMTLLIIMMIVIKEIKEKIKIDLHKEITEETFQDFSVSYDVVDDTAQVSITGPHTQPWHVWFYGQNYKVQFQWLLNVMAKNPTLYRDLELGRNKKDFLWNLFRVL